MPSPATAPHSGSEENCQRCGGPGFLSRNHDLPSAPAWCVDCHEHQRTTQAQAGHPCEDGCRLPVDHDGLCAWRI
ncbi:hypothetical protein ACIQXD_33075 [Streptomyces uncialis]|uniref:hypothetical protein n=1 Tax=Streptomyces uncialis TaxID=1048205 RepID=UPI00381BF8D8